MPAAALSPLPKNLSPLASMLYTDAALPDVAAALAAGEPGYSVNGLSGRLASPPLFYALLREDFASILDLLRSHGADFSLRDTRGRTAMHRACNVQAPPAVIPLLVAVGIDPDAPDEAGATPLLCALRSGRSELARALLAAGASAKPREDARVPLLANAIAHAPAASLRANLDMLLAAGADVHTPSPGARTALHVVVGRNMDVLEDRLWAVRALLWNGADPNAVAANGDTPLSLATGTRFPVETLQCLVAGGALLDTLGHAGAALREAARRTTQGANQALGWLLAHGVSPCSADAQQDTPLHWAALMDAAANVRTLLETPQAPELITARNDKGRTPLANAFLAHAPRAATLLLEAGASPLAVDAAGDPALFMLAESSPWQSRSGVEAWGRFLDALVARGIDLDTPRASDGQTLVHRLAAGAGNMAHRLLQAVLDRGASPSRQDHQGRQPMDLLPSTTRPARANADVLIAALAAETAARLAAPVSQRPRRRA